MVWHAGFDVTHRELNERENDCMYYFDVAGAYTAADKTEKEQSYNP
jgi:hypothetical protein